ncbi:MAG: flagella basal body P-ring formation protein FlgA [Planctomycetaceae bacterium]
MNSIIKLIALALIVAGQVSAQTTKSGIAEIKLLQRTHVSSGTVYLKDVASIRGGTLELRERLRGLELGQITVEKPFRILSAKSVRIRAILAGFDDTAFRMTGSANCLADSNAAAAVQKKPKSTNPDIESLVLTAIHTELVELWQTKPGLVSARLTKPILELDVLPEDARVLSIRPYMPPNPVPGSLTVMTVIKTDQHRPLRVSVQVEALDKSTGRAQVKGDRSAIKLTSGERVRQTGSASTRNPLPVKPVTVRARTRVRLVAVKGSLRVSLADAELMETGRVGQMVRMRNPKTNKTMFGKLTSPSTAVIEL